MTPESRVSVLTRMRRWYPGWEISETSDGHYQAVKRYDGGSRVVIRSTVHRLEAAFERLADREGI
jgi:hypothetical protein